MAEWVDQVKRHEAFKVAQPEWTFEHPTADTDWNWIARKDDQMIVRRELGQVLDALGAPGGQSATEPARLPVNPAITT